MFELEDSDVLEDEAGESELDGYIKKGWSLGYKSTS